MNKLDLTEADKKLFDAICAICDNMKTPFHIYPFPFNDTDFTYKDDGVFIITICGGYNGGKCSEKFSESWEEYFANLSTLVKNASSNGIRMWMIEASNDCLDDMFSVRFGVREQRKAEDVKSDSNHSFINSVKHISDEDLVVEYALDAIYDKLNMYNNAFSNGLNREEVINKIKERLN